MTCSWCGDHHGVDRLCQRAQRGVTRRSFFGILSAGAAGAVIASVIPWTSQPQVLATASVVGRRLYRSNGAGIYKMVAAINDNTTTTWTDDDGFTYANLPIVRDDHRGHLDESLASRLD